MQSPKWVIPFKRRWTMMRQSEFNSFFDVIATENLNIESIDTKGAVLVLMFEKLSLRHGHRQS